MQPRDKHIWLCQIQEDTGQIAERTLAVYWDPKFSEEEPMRLAISAAAEAYVASNKMHKYAPISAVLQD